MSQFRDKAREAEERRANRSNHFAPNTHGNIYQNYYLWYYAENGKVAPGAGEIGLCMYHINVVQAAFMKCRRNVFRALINATVLGFLAAFIVVSVAITAVFVPTVLIAATWVGGILFGLCYIIAGTIYATTLGSRVKHGKWPVKIKHDVDSEADFTLASIFYGVVFLPFTILYAIGHCIDIASKKLWSKFGFDLVDVVFGVFFIAVAAALVFALYSAFAESWIITSAFIVGGLAFAGIVFAIITAVMIVIDKRRENRQEKADDARRVALQQYLASPEMDMALRLIFSRVHPEKTVEQLTIKQCATPHETAEQAYQQWKPRYLRHYTSWAVDRNWMPYMWRLSQQTHDEVFAILNPTNETVETETVPAGPSKLQNVIEFVVFLWVLLKNAHSKVCPLMELPEENTQNKAVATVNLVKE